MEPFTARAPLFAPTSPTCSIARHFCCAIGSADAANYRWQARNLGRGEYGMEHLHWAAMFDQLNQVGVEMMLQGGFHSIFPFAETSAAHPEYYPLIGGQRRFRDDSQLCFTHPGMIQDYLERLSFIVTNAPPRVTRFGVGHGDNWDLCECETCLAPITLPNGEVVNCKTPTSVQHNTFFL